MLLADLDPHFLTWLRSEKYINGFGPRSVVIDGWRWKIPFHLPSPGLLSVFDQHDCDYLFGGTIGWEGAAGYPFLDGPVSDHAKADRAMLVAMTDQAHASWWLPRRAILLSEPKASQWCATEGLKHFRRRDTGPRNQAQLMVELKYPGLAV